MAYTNLDRVARKIFDDDFDCLDIKVQNRLTDLVNAVEQKLRNPPWSFNLTTAVFTEYLPSGGRIRDEIDLADFRTQNGTVVPLDYESGSSTLQLTHTPVLASGLVVYEDRGAMGGTVAGAYGASTLLVSGRDYYLDITRAGISTSGKIHRISGTWAREPRSIKVTYKAGPYAASDAALGFEFNEVFEECVSACVLHAYTFWARQKSSVDSGDNGMVPASESIGKYSRSLASQRGTIGGGTFEFGSSPEIAPEALLSPLSTFVNAGKLWSN